MEVRFLSTMPRDKLFELLENCMANLRKDHALNIQEGLFIKAWGRDLTMEEFLLVMNIEANFQLRSAGIRAPY